MKARSIPAPAPAAGPPTPLRWRTGRSAWRFRVPADRPAFVDGFRGPTQLDLRAGRRRFRGLEVGRHSEPAYQLAVVVDDAAQGVTEVVRGDDLVPSTPRQLLLYAGPRLARRRASSMCRWWSDRTADGWPSATATRGWPRCGRRACRRKRCSVCWRGRAAGCRRDRSGGDLLPPSGWTRFRAPFVLEPGLREIGYAP